MDKIKIEAKELHEIENSLNQLNYNGLGIGTMLSFYFDRLYRGDFNNRLLRKLLTLSYYFIKPVAKVNYLKDFRKNIIYFKTGNRIHLNELQHSITDNDTLNIATIIIGPDNHTGICKGNVFFLSDIIDFFKISYFFISNKKAISRLIAPLQIKRHTKTVLYINLLIQLLKAISLEKFISLQKDIKLIGADYDRGSDSSLFFAVSTSLNIKSFTLQHGVINPPVGYAPVNADEIWVWGYMARLQLMELGVPENRIRVTGTPIVQGLKISNEYKKAIQNKYNLKSGNTIILALSTPNKANDLKLIQFLAEIKQHFAMPDDNFLVKIHPARDFSTYAWIQNDFNIQVLPHHIPYEDFMNLVDVLLAHTSGIASEALYYGKKVGILDILDESAGNGLELNKYFNVPLIHSPLDFDKLLKMTFKPESQLAFYAIGKAAKKEIQRVIMQKLQLCFQ